MRIGGGIAAAVGVALLLAGCGSQAAQPTYTPTITVAPTAVPATTLPPAPTTALPTETQAPTPTAADPGRPVGQCSDDALGVGIRTSADGGAAGSEYYDLLFTNTGGASCRLRGAPGVSVVLDQKRIGPSADRNEQGQRTLTLAVGQTVVAVLQVTNIANGGGPLGDACSVQRGDGYRVYPPHSSRRFTVAESSAVACANGPVFMSVGPVEPQ